VRSTEDRTTATFATSSLKAAKRNPPVTRAAKTEPLGARISTRARIVPESNIPSPSNFRRKANETLASCFRLRYGFEDRGIRSTVFAQCLSNTHQGRKTVSNTVRNTKQPSLISQYKDKSILSLRERRERDTREEDTIRFALRNGGTATVEREAISDYSNTR